MNKRQIYCDVRKRYSERSTDAAIIVALEIENNILTGKVSYLQAENDNLGRMYDELMEKYKAVKMADIDFWRSVIEGSFAIMAVICITAVSLMGLRGIWWMVTHWFDKWGE